MSTHTPGPWVWVSDYAGPEDEWGCSTRGEIDPASFHSTGYAGNPILVGCDGETVVAAGAGEYKPYHGPDFDTEVANARLIAAAPDLLAALVAIRDATVEGGSVNTFAQAAIRKAVGYEHA